LDQQVCWCPSAYERKQHPDLPADACVRGRLIVQQVTASDGSSVTLYLFTTLPLTVEQLVQLYGRRWNVETDLRSLKRTVDLQVLHCKSADMIAKDLCINKRFTKARQRGMVELWPAPFVEHRVFSTVTRDYRLS
jgi:hypothetical protein